MAKKNDAAVFLQNRDKWIRIVIGHPGVSHPAVRVGISLAMRMRADQRFCWPSLETIHEDTGVSRRKVLYSIDELRDAGLLYRESRPNVGNIYSMIFNWLA